MPFRVMLTPIPAGLIKKNNEIVVRINVLVSIKPDDGKQYIALSDFKDQDAFAAFPEWITAAMSKIKVKVTPEGSSILTASNFRLPETADQLKRGLERLKKRWGVLEMPFAIQNIRDRLDKGHAAMDTDVIQLDKYLQKTVQDNEQLAKQITTWEEELAEMKEKGERLQRRQERLKNIIAVFSKRSTDLKEEITYHKKELRDELQKFKEDITRFDTQSTRMESLKKKESDVIKDLKKKQVATTDDLKNAQINLKKGERLVKDLKNILANNGVLQLEGDTNNEIEKKIKDKKENKEGTAVAPDKTSQYTANIGKPAIIYLNDLLGYVSNYEVLRRELGLLWTLELPLDNVSLQQLQQETGTLQIEADITQKDIFKPVLEHLVKYQLKKQKEYVADTGYIFMAASKDEKASSFAGAFLDLKAKQKDDNGQEFDVFGIHQNNPQQLRYKNTNSFDHTNGFFLIRSYASKAVNTSMQEPDTILYLENLVAGYRVDMRRAGTSNPWRSLHARDGEIRYNDVTLRIADEGWIARETVVEMKRKVNVMDMSSKEVMPLNTSLLEKKMYQLVKLTGSTQKPDPTFPELFVTISDAPLQPEGKNLYLYHTGITDVNTKAIRIDNNNQLLDRWEIDTMHGSSNEDGEVYYNYFKGNTHQSNLYASVFLPSSIVCQLAGNSLSAPAIMSSQLQQEYAKQNEEAKQAQKKDPQGINLSVYLDACNTAIEKLHPTKGSLPLLRMDIRYDVRCRLVTVDGSSVSVNQVTDCFLTETYRRQESISAPKLIKVTSNKKVPLVEELNTEMQLVVYSSNEVPNAYEQRLLIAPPGITWQLAEWLGMMDNAEGKPDATRINALASSFMPVIKFNKQEEYYYCEKGTGKFGSTVDAAQKKIPYLPDPWACSMFVTLSRRNRKGLMDKFIPQSLPFYKSMDNRKPEQVQLWQLVARAGNQTKYTSDPVTKELVVEIAPGDDIELVFYSLPVLTLADMRRFNHFYLPDNFMEKNLIGNENINPNLWSINTIRIIYPVKDTKNYPDFRSQTTAHGKEQTFEEKIDASNTNPLLRKFITDLKIPSKTSDKLELYAEWTDVVDDVKKNSEDFIPLRLKTTTMRVLDFYEDEARKARIIEEMKMGIKYDKKKNFIHEAKHRIVYDNIDLKKVEFEHSFPDTRQRICRYYLAAGNRFKSMHPAIDDQDMVRSAYSEVNLDSTAPPPAPVYDYAMPAFYYTTNKPVSTEKTTLQNLNSITRQNHIIRVYLKRPWYATGEGEKLALVLPAEKAPASTKYKSCCSSWGRDITINGTNLTPMNIDAILNAVSVEENIRINHPELREDKTALYTMALFDVKFDSKQELWFVDIALRMPESYAPFVQMALARYQPYSRNGMEASDVTLTDFIQLQADRSIQVIKLKDGRSYNLTLTSVKKKKASFNTCITASLIRKDKNLSGQQGELLIKKEEIATIKEFISKDQNYTLEITEDELKGCESILIQEYEVYENAQRIVFGDIINLK